MALVAGGRGMSMGQPRNVYDGNRHNPYSDEAACGCLPKIKRSQRMSRTKLLKERIRQFSIWYFENEDQREVEHVKRRQDRKKKAKSFHKLKGSRILRWLFYMNCGLWVVGLTLTLCSTVKTIGKDTPFYDKREIYRIVGPLVILLAVVLMFTLSICKRKFLKANDMHAPKRRFYIKEKKEKKTPGGKEMKKSDSCDTDDSGNVEDMELDNGPKHKFWITRKGDSSDIGEEDVAIAKEGFDAEIDEEVAIELSEFNHATNAISELNILRRADKRKAWAKTKWMRMNMSLESEESVDLSEDGEHRILGQGQQNQPSTLKARDSLERYPLLHSISVDSADLTYPLQRDFSTKSKASTVSNFSNFSETAPLVKK